MSIYTHLNPIMYTEKFISLVEGSHNSIPDITPFEDLPQFRRKQVLEFYHEGKSYSGSLSFGLNGKSSFIASKLSQIMESGDPNELALSLYDELTNGTGTEKSRAWSKLYDALFPYARSLARHELYYYPDDAEDVASQAMLTLHDKIEAGEWERGSGVMTWLKYIVKNKAMNFKEKMEVRKALSHDSIEDENQEEDSEGDVRYASASAPAPEEDQPDEHLMQGEDLQDKRSKFHNTFMKSVQQMIDELPEEEKKAIQTVVFLAQEEEASKTQSEMAKDLGWPLHRFKSRLENARWYLKRWLEKEPEIQNLMQYIFDGTTSVGQGKRKKMSESIEDFDPIQYLQESLKGEKARLSEASSELRCEIEDGVANFYVGDKLIAGLEEGASGDDAEDVASMLSGETDVDFSEAYDYVTSKVPFELEQGS